MRLVAHEPGFVRITINCRSRSIPAGEALELVKLGESWWDQLAALDGMLTVGV